MLILFTHDKTLYGKSCVTGKNKNSFSEHKPGNLLLSNYFISTSSNFPNMINGKRSEFKFKPPQSLGYSNSSNSSSIIDDKILYELKFKSSQKLKVILIHKPGFTLNPNG